MAEIECVAKKWGSSIGIIIPKDVVNDQHIKPDQMLRITVRKVPLIQDLWNIGSIKETMPTQKIKDMLREGW